MRFGGVVFVVDCLKLRLDGTFKSHEIHEVDEVLYLKIIPQICPEMVMFPIFFLVLKII